MRTRRSGLLGLAVLTLLYLGLIAARRPTPEYTLAILFGGLFLLVAAVLTASPALRGRWLQRPRSIATRTVVALLPWAGVAAIVFMGALWWTQRTPALRLFVLYCAGTWALAWCWPVDRPGRDWFAGPRRAVLVLAAGFAVLGLDGAAFGVSTFGVGVSVLLFGLALVAIVAACLGSRNASLKIFVASLGLCAGFAILELTVRLFQIGHNVQEADSREVARKFYRLTPPGSAFLNRPNVLDEFPPALVSINSLGLRGPELTDAQVDLLLLGDSMIEARQLPWEQTITPHLRQALAARSLPLRVAAHGMRGWSPLLEWNWYLKVGRRLKPRTLFLFFFWNDLWTSGTEPATFEAELGPDGRPLYFRVSGDPDWVWYKHVRTVRVAADAWHRLSVEQVRRAFSTIRASGVSREILDDSAADELARTLTPRPLTTAERTAVLTQPLDALPSELRALAQLSFWPRVRPLALWTEAQNAAAAATEAELRRFADDVTADGGRLVIVFVPNPIQVSPSECAVGRLFDRVDTHVVLPPDTGIQEWLRGLSARQGIEVLDPTSAMQAWHARQPPGAAAPLYLRADCHWSEQGHAFMADYLAEWCARHAAELRGANR